MMRKVSGALIVLFCLLLLLIAGLFSVTLWGPRVAAFWLPEGVRLQIHGYLQPGLHSLTVPDISLLRNDCKIAEVRGLSAGYRQGEWQLSARRVRLDSTCFGGHSRGDSETSPPETLSALQSVLPAVRVQIAELQVLPWAEYSGSLLLTHRDSVESLRLQGDRLSLDAQLDHQQLHIRRLQVTIPALPEPVSAQGTIDLSPLASQWPPSGKINGSLSLSGKPLQLLLRWQQQQGEITLTTDGQPQALLHLPWSLSPDTLTISQGQWFWPYGPQPLQGGVNVVAENWQAGLAGTRFSGRMNVLTRGQGGKGNAVLSFGPGKLDYEQSELPLRLTGNAGTPQLQFFTSLPASLSGPLLRPEIRFLSGSLLRMRGRILNTLQVDEARFPLAGVRLSVDGVTGPLQAILKVHNKAYGQYRLQLSGKAEQFWPDNGRWNWRYWGKGNLTPLQAGWDLQGKGDWTDRQITLQSLSTGFNRITSAGFTSAAPRLSLTRPLHWSRDPLAPAFAGEFLLTTGTTRFDYGGNLPPAKIAISLKGKNPDNFLYNATLRAGETVPLILRGRWDGTRLRGQMWWPEQPLQVFRTLLKPTLKMKLTGGTLRAQAAFSVSAEDGFQAGGHWVIRNGSLWTQDNQFSAVDFSLPFRYRQQRWLFGYHQPVRLNIGRLTNQFDIKDITAGLQGYYPWDERHPLQLTDVSMSLLDGKMSLTELRFPQHQSALLKAENISLSPLITALHPKQIAMSGRVNGEFPLQFNRQQDIIRNGWIKNDGPLTLRVDKDLIDSITTNNMAAGVAVDWLRYMEISRADATVRLTSDGELFLKSAVQGTSRFSNKDQRVNLNYTHQENLFMLWRSLSFGDTLQSLLSQQLVLPAGKGTDHESR